MPNLTLLIVSGGEAAVELAQHAKDVSCYVVVLDADVQALAFAQADSCLIADANRPEDTAAAAERFSRKVRRIDGVMSIGLPVAATVAAVAERLRLRGVSREISTLMGDRLAVKQRLLAAGVPIPWFSPVATPQALQRIAIERGPHLILKPADSHDGRGVQQVADVKGLEGAFVLVRQHSPTQRVMVEDCLAGIQLTAHALMEHGQCTAVWLAEERQQAGVADALVRTAAAIALANGPLALKLVLRGDEVYVVDVSVQFSGEVTRPSGLPFMRRVIAWTLGDADQRPQAFISEVS